MKNFLYGQGMVYFLLSGWTTYSIVTDDPEALSSLGMPMWLAMALFVLPICSSGVAAYLWNLGIGPGKYFENPGGHPLALLRMGILAALLTTLLIGVGLMFPFNEELTIVFAALGATTVLMATTPGIEVGQCRACGYDIRRSLTMGRCPECGMQFQSVPTKRQIDERSHPVWSGDEIKAQGASPG